MVTPPTDWFEPPAETPADEVLYVDVAGYEGPLDLLLDLARGRRWIWRISRSSRSPSNI